LGLQIDDEFEFDRLNDRHVRRVGAFVPPPGTDGSRAVAAEQIYLALPEARRFPDHLLGTSAGTLAG
jgi:hypothetical protein